jgi:uncharacterized membrane protein
MESRFKILGHPVHPMLIVFPVGLFVTAVIFDILYLATNNTVFSTVSFFIIAVGVLGGLLAAVFGFIDWSALPNDSRAKNIGLWHGIGNFVIVLLFAGSWFIRWGAPNYVPSSLALTLSFLAGAMAFVTAWIGGELVYRLGVAVDPGANVDAPSSLSTSSTEVSSTSGRQTTVHR